MLRDLLNERRWRLGDLSDCVVIVLHRGAPDDRREIPGHAISAVLSGGLEVVASAGGWAFDGDAAPIDVIDTVVVPFHRVLEVRAPDGTSLWRR